MGPSEGAGISPKLKSGGGPWNPKLLSGGEGLLNPECWTCEKRTNLTISLFKIGEGSVEGTKDEFVVANQSLQIDWNLKSC